MIGNDVIIADLSLRGAASFLQSVVQLVQFSLQLSPLFVGLNSKKLNY